MGAWYWIGVTAGLGAAAAVLLAGLVGRLRAAAPLVVVGGIAAGALIGLALGDWPEIAAGAAGGALGGVAAAPLVRGALGRGGTVGATAALVGAAALVLAALAFVPVVGYVLALLLPVVALRTRRRGGERYAGLRILARD